MSGHAPMPEQIGRFRLRSMLGRGAMGVVYLGHDEAIDRLVAIKLIRADLLDTEERESYLKRFSNEAKIAGRCMHANIVGLYDFAMHDGNPYLVMEYVNGVGLQQFFPRGTKRPVEEVYHIALQVLDALHYAHARSIVHRDIKPANILMMPDLSLKITDFGISRLTSMELTATPLLIGTPSYMSPEQCLGSALDGRNDLFSLGCVLYELLTGERAFGGVNYTETIFAIVNKPHTPVAALRDDLPPGFAEAIDKALAKSPADRYPNAAAFARTLDEIVREANVHRTTMPAVIIDSSRAALTGAPADSVAVEGAGPAAEAEPTGGHAPSPETIVVPRGEALPQPAELPGGEPAPAPEPAPEPLHVEPEPVVEAPAEVHAHAQAPEHFAEPVVEAHPAPVTEDIDPDATLIRPLVVTEEPAPGASEPVEPVPAEATLSGVEPAHVPQAVPVVAPEPRAHEISFPPPPVPESGPEPVPEHAVHEDHVATATLARPDFAPAPALDETAARPRPDASPEPAPQFMSGLMSSPMHAPAPVQAPVSAELTPGESERIARCLAVVMGPIAPLLVRRTERPGMDAATLARELAALVPRAGERAAFLSLVAKKGAGVRR